MSLGEKEKDVARCKGTGVRGDGSSREWQKTTGGWRCCPGPLGRRREGGAQRSSGLEKVGVSDCQGTDTERREWEQVGLVFLGICSSFKLQVSDYTYILLFQGPHV